jgi:hypothetical protein
VTHPSLIRGTSARPQLMQPERMSIESGWIGT